MIVYVIYDLLIVDFQQIVEFHLIFEKLFHIKFQVLVLRKVFKTCEKILIVGIVQKNKYNIWFWINRD